MKFICIVACLLAAFFLPNLVHAIQSPSELSADSSNPELKELSQHPIWRALLGYDGRSDHSAINSRDFFIDSDGSKDPSKELLATLTAFSQPLSRSDKHPQCKYPGRYAWLERKLLLNEFGIQPVHCPEFDEFTSSGQISSVSVILVSGYLGNPASYYGHLLLKFNTPDHIGMNNLENQSINFGANIPPNANMIGYIFKGIFGGYDSSFTSQKYYLHDQLYRENEQRDMWEYQLDLSQEDNELLIAHLWELLDKDYTYYFLNRNCAYRVGEFLEIVLGEDFVNSLRPWETPQAIVQRLGRLKGDGRPLVKKVIYLPSRQSRLYNRFGRLNSKEKSVLYRIVNDVKEIEGDSFYRMAMPAKYRVLDTLLEYYKLVGSQEKQNTYNKNLYKIVLEKRYRLPPGGATHIFESENRPHLGHMPSYVSVGFLYNEDLGETLTFRLRPVYYDSLDAGHGHIRNASLSMGEGEVMLVGNSQLRIKSLDLLKIEKLSRNLTGLPGDRKLSWYIDVGAQQRSLSKKDDLVAKVNGGIGYAIALFGEKTSLAAYAGAGYRGSFSQDNDFYLSAVLSLHLNVLDDFSVRTDVEHRRFIGSTYGEQIYKFQIRKALTPQRDLRMYYSEHIGKELGLSMGFYW